MLRVGLRSQLQSLHVHRAMLTRLCTELLHRLFAGAPGNFQPAAVTAKGTGPAEPPVPRLSVIQRLSGFHHIQLDLGEGAAHLSIAARGLLPRNLLMSGAALDVEATSLTFDALPVESPCVLPFPALLLGQPTQDVKAPFRSLSLDLM